MMFSFMDWKQYYPRYMYDTRIGRTLRMYYHYMMRFKIHNIIVEGIASEGPRDQLITRFTRARIPQKANVISTSEDHALPLSYFVFQQTLFQQKVSSGTSFERIVLPISGIERVLTLLVDDGRIYADERHAPSVNDCYHRTRLQYLLDALQYPEYSFNKIYRRGKNYGA